MRLGLPRHLRRGPLPALLCAALLTACGSNAARSSRPTPGLTGGLAEEVAQLRHAGYNVTSHVTSFGADGTRMDVYHSLCSGSTDGHCQSVDVFIRRTARAVWHRQFTGVRSLRATTGGFALVVDRYRPSDPLCCPSLSPKHETYVWQGGRLKRAAGVPPSG